jgi:hypothetical protein
MQVNSTYIHTYTRTNRHENTHLDGAAWRDPDGALDRALRHSHTREFLPPRRTLRLHASALGMCVFTHVRAYVFNWIIVYARRVLAGICTHVVSIGKGHAQGLCAQFAVQVCTDLSRRAGSTKLWRACACCNDTIILCSTLHMRHKHDAAEQAHATQLHHVSTALLHVAMRAPPPPSASTSDAASRSTVARCGKRHAWAALMTHVASGTRGLH